MKYLTSLSLAAALAAASTAYAQAPVPNPLANELEVSATNLSQPVLCAENDNVEINFTSPLVRHMKVQAIHPAFVNTIQVDRWAPDWTTCDMSHDPAFVAEAKRVTFWETPKFWLTGYIYPSFWRPGNVPFKIGNNVENGLHLVQLWMRHKERAEEIFVIYPPDGYMRARPLPPSHLPWTAYGSSFLIGPVETKGRPIVELRQIGFDPDTNTFTLDFTRGGSARVKLDIIDEDRLVLDVTYDGAMPANQPFASLRSMYVTQFNADVAQTAWRVKGAKGWSEAPIMSFPDQAGASGKSRSIALTEFWAGRTVPSRHNLSAPDMVFSHFSDKTP